MEWKRLTKSERRLMQRGYAARGHREGLIDKGGGGGWGGVWGGWGFWA